MANRFTKPVQSQYVPTIAPPNPQVYQQVAQNLQQRQQRGMEQYDALQQSLNQLNVLPSDKPLLEKRRKRIEQKLGQFADENDFIDAMPAIRREARNLTKEMQEGPLADAIQNKERAKQVFEKIEDTDWGGQMKENMKDYYLQNYEDAESTGRLGDWTPPKYVDIEKELDQTVESIDKVKSDKIGYVPDPDGGYRKAKITTSGRDPEQIRSVVEDKLMSDPEIVRALSMEARMQGNQSSEEIMDYIRDQASNYSTVMETRHATDSRTFSGVDFDDMSAVGSNTLGRRTAVPGTLQSTNILQGDVNTHIANMATAAKSGEQQKYNMMEEGLHSTFAKAMEEGKVTHDDYEYLMDNLQNEGSKLGFGIRDVLSAGESAAQFLGADINIGGEQRQDERFMNIINKLNDFTEDSGGIVGTTFPFDNEKVKEQVGYVFSNQSPQNFEIMNKEIVEDMDEKEKQQFIQTAITQGEPRGVMTVDENRAPYYRITMPVEKDGQEKVQNILLKEKTTQNISDRGHPSIFEEVVDTAFGGDKVAQELKDRFKLHNVPETGANAYEHLPAKHRQGLGDNKFVSFIQQERGDKPSGGTIVEMGESKDNRQTIKAHQVLDGSIINFVRNSRFGNPQSAESNYRKVQEMVNNSDTLRETEKTAILEKLSNLNYQDIPEDAMKRLRSEYNKPYEFSNKIEAINFATTRQEKQPEQQ